MPKISLNFRFSSDKIKQVFEEGRRNIAVCGGFGSGKTYGILQKVTALCVKFPGYRWVIGRQSLTSLKRTTMQTFHKVCPPELYAPEYGGKKIESNPPYIDFINGSRIYWMHFDQDIGNLLSLEVNGAFVDQAEEVREEVFLVLDSRVGRWDNAKVPADLLQANPDWPRNKFTGKPIVPAYNILAFNPPDEGEFSYLYRYFHPESEYWQENNSKTHIYYQIASYENKALAEDNLKVLKSRDREWQERFVEGNFQSGPGAIHKVDKLSIISPSKEFVENLLKRAVLTRVLDHGSSAPTCCLWWAAYRGYYFCYREYYQPNRTISHHRQRIAELSGNELYTANYADPSIFKKDLQKFGGFWSVADEYISGEYSSPRISWLPADNNELATRNRINELLHVDPNLKHPITGEMGSPRIFFIKATDEYPYGVKQAHKQTASQKKELLAEVEGKKIYGDEREKAIEDHAYDCVRYYIATHLQHKGEEPPRKYSPNSFRAAQKRIKAVIRHRALKRNGL